MFDVGPRGHVKLGECALVHGARVICDSEIVIGDYALPLWNVVLMDTYRVPLGLAARRRELGKRADEATRGLPRRILRPDQSASSETSGSV